MTNDEFLKALERYREVLRPQTYKSLQEAVRSGTFAEEAKQVILDQIELSQQMLNALDAAQTSQQKIYQEGTQKLEALQTEAKGAYKKMIQQAEAESDVSDQKTADTLLIKM